MAPPRRNSRSLRSGDANQNATSPTSNQAAPNPAVSRMELDSVVADLHNHMETTCNSMYDRLSALLAAQANPTNRRVEIDLEENARSSALGHRNDNAEEDAEDRRSVSDGDKGLNAGPSNLQGGDSKAKCAPLRAGGAKTGASKSRTTPRDRLCKQVSEKVTGDGSLDPPNNEEYISGMIRQIMKESQQRKEDEEDWGFAPSKTPFTEKILKAEFPRKFSPPTIPAYGGTSDPNQFLYKYDWHMTGARATDELKCRYFPVYLKGVALLWFTKLPARSVDQFSDLTRKFKDQFRLYASKAKDIMSLSSLEQGPGESIRCFLNRFNNALAEVGNPEPQMILSNLMRAIDKTTDFGRWLKMKEPTSLDKFYKQADEFIRLENAPSVVKAAVVEVAKENKESGGQKRGMIMEGRRRRMIKSLAFLMVTLP